MVEAVLSDFDGTLVESNWLHAAAWKDAFDDINISLDIETLRRQIGKGVDQLIPVFVPWWKLPLVEEPLKTYRSFLFHQDYFHKVEPFPKVRDLFLRLNSPASASPWPLPRPQKTSPPTRRSPTPPTSSTKPPLPTTPTVLCLTPTSSRPPSKS